MEEEKMEGTGAEGRQSGTKRRRTVKKSTPAILFRDCEDNLEETPEKKAEEAAINSMQELRQIMRVCDFQIARFMKLIQNAQQAPEGLVVTGTSEKKEEIQGTQRGAESDFSENQIVTNTTASYELILRYNNEIEKAKREKLRCLEILLKGSPEKKEEDPNDNFMYALSDAAEAAWKEQADISDREEENP